MKDEIIRIEKIIFDVDLYPRFKTDWQTAYDYSESMRTGAKFPNIILGEFQKDKYLIDGWHRIEAIKMIGEDFVTASIIKYKNKNDMLLDAIKYNIKHGKQLSVQEKVNLAVRLEELKIDTATISNLIGISKVKMDKLKLRKVKIDDLGNKVVVKAPLENMTGHEINTNTRKTLEGMTGVRNQNQILKILVNMLTDNLFDLNDSEVRLQLMNIRKLISEKKLKKTT